MRHLIITLSTVFFLLYTSILIAGPNIEAIRYTPENINEQEPSNQVRRYDGKLYSLQTHRKYSAAYRLGFLGQSPNKSSTNVKNESDKINISALETDNKIRRSVKPSYKKGRLNRRDRNM